MKFVSADGGELQIAGIANVLYHNSHKSLMHPTLFVRNLRSKGIIGTDFMNKLKAVTDFDRGVILSEGKHFANLPVSRAQAEAGRGHQDLTIHAVPEVISDRKQANRNSYGRARHSVTIPAMSEKVITMIAEGEWSAGELLHCRPYLGVNKKRIDSEEGVGHVFLAEGIACVNHQGTIKVCVQNPTQQPAYLKRGQKLCSINREEESNLLPMEIGVEEIVEAISSKNG